ncbi:hypothetical protein V5N11_022181 [Cardamine amara subsp. amara]|uniref:DUF4408 domain-containing protein n=1 Tax=Cardamine amara subsp. amara TaxID=228776 RepID=A0ABD1C0B3_CARAN
MMSSTIIKAVLISTGITATSLFLKSFLPIAIEFAVLRFPIFWCSFVSWLKPPYLFVVINVIITIIIASSRYYQSIGDHDEEDNEILYGDDYNVQEKVNLDFVATIPPPILVTEVMEESSGVINGGDEFVEVLKSERNQVPSMMEELESLPPAEKPLSLARSGHRKLVKGCSRKKALRVVKPKRHENFENTLKSTPLTSHYKRPDTFGLGASDVKPALRKAETFRDVTNYHQPPTVTTPVKMSPSPEELNRRFEEFIKKGKEERLESLRLDK